MVLGTLKVLSVFVEWMPVEITWSFMGKVFEALGDPELHVAAITCVERLLAKKMPVEKKLRIIDSLQVVSIVEGFDIKSCDLALSDVPKAMANLIDTLGSHVLECNAEQYLQVVLNKAVACLDCVRFI